MACQRCGSEWKTLNGKDMVSCPECCKVQRCKARKQGRLPASETKACERCGQLFEAVGGNAIARSRHCVACLADARLEWRREYQKGVAAGVRTAIPKQPQPTIQCRWCGKETKDPNQSRYCSRECFFEARKAGKQAWDRTKQLESIWHRGGRWACAPSRKPVQEMRTNLLRFLAGVARAYSCAAKKAKACEICGADCYGTEARFCSLSCIGKSKREVPCCRCGISCVVHGTSKVKMCESCRRTVKAAIRRRNKKQTGTYRKRCRIYGGSHNAEVTRRKVFERDGWRCHVCKRKTLRHWSNNHPREATVDHHPIPLSRGGDHDWHNVRCACRQCNAEKSNTWDGQKRLTLTG